MWQAYFFVLTTIGFASFFIKFTTPLEKKMSNFHFCTNPQKKRPKKPTSRRTKKNKKVMELTDEELERMDALFLNQLEQSQSSSNQEPSGWIIVLIILFSFAILVAAVYFVAFLIRSASVSSDPPKSSSYAVSRQHYDR